MRGNQSQVIGQALLGSLFDAEGLPSLPGMIIPTTVPARLSRMRWHNSYREAGVEVGSISLARGPSANFKERDSGKFAIRPTSTWTHHDAEQTRVCTIQVTVACD